MNQKSKGVPASFWDFPPRADRSLRLRAEVVFADAAKCRSVRASGLIQPIYLERRLIAVGRFDLRQLRHIVSTARASRRHVKVPISATADHLRAHPRAGDASTISLPLFAGFLGESQQERKNQSFHLAVIEPL